MKKITITKASLCETEKIYDTVKLSFKEYQKLSGMPDVPSAMLETREDIQKDISENIIFCAWVGEKFTGCVRLKMNGERCYFYRFSVLPKYQGSGVGMALIEAAADFAKTSGAEILFLHTAQNIAKLASIYMRCGFQLLSVDSTRGYPRALMEKKL